MAAQRGRGAVFSGAWPRWCTFGQPGVCRVTLGSDTPQDKASQDTRQKQKLLCSQLQVVAFLLDAFAKAPGPRPNQDHSDALVRQEVTAAKQCWKELKAGYQAGVAALTEAAPGALAQFNRAQCQAQCLQDALTRHQHQRQGALKKQWAAQEQLLQEQVLGLRAQVTSDCTKRSHLQGELQSLQDEAQAWRDTAQQALDWCHLLETLQGARLLLPMGGRTSPEAAELELSWAPPPGDLEAAGPPLRVALCQASGGKVEVMPCCPLFLPPKALPPGLGPALLELEWSRRCQAQLLSEITELQHRFAIDWDPQRRHLRLLCPTAVWTLEVEPGYPGDGGVRLSTGSPLPCLGQPPQETSSLSNWLEYLSALDA
ncbi:ZW10 interactor [Alligator sinensis]|uniref:ZW10 interactor n=1 Tax=Alligator sinensis TaxID=38654 RepID=A0A3Q0HCR9_ALLSI|nr:ZW10 interactor [Alligator sinensis]